MLGCPNFPFPRRSNAPYSNKIQRGIINYCLAPSSARPHIVHTKTQRETSRSRIIRVNCCKHVHCRPPLTDATTTARSRLRLILSAILIIICQLVQKIACLPEDGGGGGSNGGVSYCRGIDVCNRVRVEYSKW